ncbi:MAG: DUF2384 domain-containing protein [Desulfarculus sp.]|nr:DUF2384 domain-containing protein [Desulfarculus sp.]
MQAMQGIGEVLGGRKCLGKEARTAAEMDALIRQGLPMACASQVQASLALPDQSFADFLAVGTRTLLRMRQEKKKLSVAAGDRLFRLARIVSLAREVLEDQAAARNWLCSPQVGLGGKRPLDLMLTEAGCREVEELLGRLEYGVLA